MHIRTAANRPRAVHKFARPPCSRSAHRPPDGHWHLRPGMVRSRDMSTALSPLLAPMLSSAAMRAVCDDAATLQNMLDFEAALARAEAACGVIPTAAAGPIGTACRSESFDLPALAEAATRSGNLAIPLVKALTAAVAKADADAARRHRRAACRSRSRRRRLCQTGTRPSQHRDGGAHLAAARAADAVR